MKYLILVILLSSIGIKAFTSVHTTLPNLFEENMGQLNVPGEYILRIENVVYAFVDNGIKIYDTDSTLRKINSINFHNTASWDVQAINEHSTILRYITRDSKGKAVSKVSRVSDTLFVENAYNGIDISFYINENALEFDFIIQPGIDVSQIEFSLDENTSIHGSQELRSGDDIQIVIPEVYQLINGKKSELESRFVEQTGDRFSFKLDDVNPNLITVIDPKIIYSSGFGTSNNSESMEDMVVDENGFVYMTGKSGDLFYIAKLLPGRSTWEFINFYPSPSITVGHIALDDDNNVIVAGTITDDSLPVMNAFQSGFGGIVDVFIMKVDNDGELVFSSYIGGRSLFPEPNPLGLNGREYTSGIVTDRDGNIYIAGESDGAGFPVTEESRLAEWDLFFCKISSSGELLFSRLFGSLDDDRVGTDDIDQGIAVDSLGQVYIIGNSDNIDGGFPIEGNFFANRPTNTFSGAATLTIFKPAGSTYAISYSSFLLEFDPTSIYLTDDANIVLAGAGLEDLAINLYDTGRYSIVIIDAFEREILFHSLIPVDHFRDVKLDIAKTGNFWIAGENILPNIEDTVFNTFNLSDDRSIFIVEIDPGKNEIGFTAVIGGDGNDKIGGLDVSNDNLYIGGTTRSTDFFETNDAFPDQEIGAGDVFLTVISLGEENEIEFFDPNPEYLLSGFLGASNFENIRDITEVEELQQALVNRVKGCVADGVTQMVLKYTLPISIEEAEIESTLGNIELLWGQQSTIQNDKNVLYALYTAPELSSDIRFELDGELLTQEVDVSLSYISNEIQGLFESSLKLVPPPIILVHGTFDNPDNCWKSPIAGEKSMFDALTNEGYRVFALDYRDSNGSQFGPCPEDNSFLFGTDRLISSFHCNRNVLMNNPGGIEEALDYYRNELSIAVTQVDVIGHSMGGLIPRIYASDDELFDRYNTGNYYRPDNNNEGDINRLITIASTHSGSDLSEFQAELSESWQSSDLPFNEKLANFSLTQALWFVGGVAETGAVRDQRPLSSALRRIGPTPIPSHSVVCTVSELKDFEDNIGDENTFFSYANFYKGATAYFYFFPGVVKRYLLNKIRSFKSAPAGLQNSGSSNTPFTNLSKQEILNASRGQNFELLNESILQGLAKFWQNWHILQEAADPDQDWIVDMDRYELSFETAEYNHFELDDDFTDLVRAREYDLIAGEKPYENDFKEEDQNAVDYLRYLIFKNDLNDGVVRRESQIGGLSGDYISEFDSHIHSFAPRYPDVIDRVIDVLGQGMNHFSPDGFPNAGLRKFESIPDPQSIADATEGIRSITERFGDDAVCWSGMVPSHAQAFLSVAVQEDVVILGRPVNPDATPLIAMGAATKGMNLKGKSSDWGPQKGYIPVNQKYSKLWNLYGDDHIRRDTQIVIFTGKTTQQLLSSPEEVVRRHLRLNYDCSDEPYLIYYDSTIVDAQESIRFITTASDGYRVYDWEESNDSDCPTEGRAFTEDISGLTAMDVMSKPSGDTSLYYTADYDLLAIGYHDNNLAGYEDDPYDIPTLTDFDDNQGLITERQKSLLDLLNDEVRMQSGYMGGDVSHHGPENQFYVLDNPSKGSPYIDYPVIAFYKDSDGQGVIHAIPKGPENFRDRPLKRFMAQKRREGYDLYENIHSPGWSWDHYGKYTYQEGWDDRDDPNLPDSPEEIPFPDECPLDLDKTNKYDNRPLNSQVLDRSVQDYSSQFIVPYPNPSVDRVEFDIYTKASQNIEYAVIRISGETVITNEVHLSHGNNHVSIDLRSVATGSYFLVLSDGEKVMSKMIHINK